MFSYFRLVNGHPNKHRPLLFEGVVDSSCGSQIDQLPESVEGKSKICREKKLPLLGGVTLWKAAMENHNFFICLKTVNHGKSSINSMDHFP
jgi:hypothetical protein